MRFFHRFNNTGVLRLGLCLLALFSFALAQGCVDENEGELLVVATPEVIEVTVLPTPELTPVPTPSPTPEPTLAELMEQRFPHMFSMGDPILEPWQYRGEKLGFTVETVEDREMFGKKIRYYVVDIYVKDVTAIRGGFSRKKYWAKRQDLVPLARSYGALLAISGVHYAYQRDGGIVLHDAVVYREGADPKDDLCVLYTDGTVETFDMGTYDINSIAASKEPWQAWSFGPTLIDRGVLRSGWDIPIASEQAPRAAIGYYEPGHHCFVLSEGRIDRARGLKLDELALLMQHLGCYTAYNLDGGDTAQLYWQDSQINEVYKVRDLWDIIYLIDD